ncbi:VanZ family protein [Lacrimispora saccharolytica]|uniref:VanZ family protein n=1 Tax=Lacrimispora saccharolytica (strain ATCC 35040 / DSM 2544 / NRCC 2533 / WM1) TaxID=610130 RepID=D9R5X5_LACSW|nr:VanZ family protein [Lacrimispora saccharolytica]ADL03409.1 VanZ family protein [[Clostridium] saccharolyticum WM1]QRV18441.1 VanZ family protein [Lacrimispora saccharolytica]
MKKKRIWTAVTLLYVLFIFSNSMKPAEVSSADSGWVLRMAQESFVSMGISTGWLTEHFIRKTGHFSEYTLLGILLYGCVGAYGFPKERKYFIRLTAGFMVPFVDETIQLMVRGRSGQISDVWLDCGGVAFGLFAAALLSRYIRTEYKHDKKLSNGSGI